MKCLKCRAENPEGERFCQSCGTALVQAAPANAPVSAPVSTPASPSKGLPLKKLAAIAVVIVIIAIVLLSGRHSPQPAPVSQPATPATLVPIKPTSPATQQLNDYTKEYFENYTNDLMSTLGLPGDPFNLNADSRAKLAGLLALIDSPSPVAIFDANAYSSLELFQDGGTYYLKPPGLTGGTSEYIEVISKKTVDTEAMLSAVGDEMQAGIVRLFFENAPHETQENAYQKVNSELTSYLNARVSAGALASYSIDSVSDAVELAYPGDDLIFEVKPYKNAQMIKSTVFMYADPLSYASGSLEYFEGRLSSGEVLAYSSLIGDYSFYPRALLSSELQALLDDSATKDEKLLRLAGQMRFMSDGDFMALTAGQAGASPTGMAVAAGAGDLLDRSGAIVPPSRLIYYLEAPDYESSLHAISGSLEGLRSPQGPFKAFLENDYTAMAYVTPREGQSVEKLAAMLSSTSVSNVYLHAHGAWSKLAQSGVLTMEIYDMGPMLAADFSSSPLYENFRKKLAQIRLRADRLRGLYGQDSILIRFSGGVADDEGFAKEPPADPKARKAWEKIIETNKARYGRVCVSQEFFNKFIQIKKALFILFSCHGGHFSKDINSRVLLAPEKDYTTNGDLFLISDLSKLSRYLYKEPLPGSIAITPENMRNYGILSSGGFVQGQINPSNDETKYGTPLYAQCMGSRDTLCSIVLYGNAGQTISVSPHIMSADGSIIKFNAPMDSGILPESVVTLDASQCSGARQEDIALKPEWDQSDSYGDKIIKLPWKGKVYRDWTGDDTPETPHAVLTVRNDKAVSKLSNVRLTGNSDCCAGSSCSLAECWRNPATIKYNGNHPNTDFVFMMPCVQGGYYESCDEAAEPRHVKAADEAGEYKDKPFPEYMRFRGECYKLSERDESAVDAVGWSEDGECLSECNEAPPIVIGGPDCLKNILEVDPYTCDLSQNGRVILNGKLSEAAFSGGAGPFMEANGGIASFGSHIAYVQNNREAVYDGAVVYTAPETDCQDFADVRIFGDHILTTSESSCSLVGGYEMLFDGRKMSIPKDSQCMMSTASLLCVTPDNSVIYDGRVLGTTESYSPDFAAGDAVVFGDSVAFRDAKGHVKYKPAGSGEVRDMGVSDEGDIHLFGNHIAFTRRGALSDRVIYDGADIGEGGSTSRLTLFGDHVAFVAECNPLTREGPCYPISRGADKEWVYYDGRYYDYAKELGLPATSDYNVQQISLSGDHIAFLVDACPRRIGGGECVSEAIVYDWEILARGPGLGGLELFGDHITYTKNDHVFYDGRDMGEGSMPVLFGDHIAFLTPQSEEYAELGDYEVCEVPEVAINDGTSDETSSVMLDGKKYENRNTIYENAQNCYQYYLENSVSTSPYGTVSY